MNEQVFVIIFGPSAVGKMTVGQELSRLTGFKLFHNHLAIESVLPIFSYGDPVFKKLVSEFRTRIFEEVAASDIPGLIFTYVWDLKDESDHREVRNWCRIFERRGAHIYLVELEASIEVRLKRNRTENRLSCKPSKREIAISESMILNHEPNLKLNTEDDFTCDYPLLKINNTDLSAEETAIKIRDVFKLPAST